MTRVLTCMHTENWSQVREVLSGVTGSLGRPPLSPHPPDSKDHLIWGQGWVPTPFPHLDAQWGFLKDFAG